MIPKVIHYCWFGGNPLTDEVKAYIATWKRHFPGFEIKRWDESNFDVDALLYTRQAYFAKKYAFVSDVARLYALVSEGGLYFDTDILVKKPFPEEWFELDGFGSFEHDKYVQTGVMAGCQGNPLLKAFLASYRGIGFFKGTRYDITTNVEGFTRLMSEFGFVMNNTEQIRHGFAIFPQEYLCANDWKHGRYDDARTYAVHDFKGAWGREALDSYVKFRIKMLLTIIKWRFANLF